MPHRLAVLRELGWPTAPCFCWPCDDASALIGDAGTPFRTRLRITHEPGHGSEQFLDEKETFVTFPGLPPEAGETWLLWLDRDDYRGVGSQPMRWPVRETLVLKAIDGDAPDVTVEIESLQYTYEAGIEGAFVAYPARGDGDGVPKA